MYTSAKHMSSRLSADQFSGIKEGAPIEMLWTESHASSPPTERGKLYYFLDCDDGGVNLSTTYPPGDDPVSYVKFRWDIFSDVRILKR